MKKRLVIFGCGGHARSVLDVLHKNGEFEEISLVDENADVYEKIMGHSVVKGYEWQYADFLFPAFGNNKIREEIMEAYGEEKFVAIISQNSYLGESVSWGCGTFVACGAHLGPDVKIGVGCIVNTGSIIEHESKIGNYVHVAPGSTVCGRSRIGNRVMLGAGSIVVDKVSIGDDVVIGAGGVVIHDIIHPGTYVGVPVHRIG